jgi:hypothetical protein
MRFNAYPMRRAGKLLPRFLMWTGEVTGDLYVSELRDIELNRAVRVATMRESPGGEPLLPPLLDAVLVAAKPDWWTLTGWERIEDGGGAPGAVAFQQSWVLIPVELDSPRRATAGQPEVRVHS